MREIRALRANGFDIDVVSVRPPDRSPEVMTAEEREELGRTRAIKQIGVAGALGAHLREAITNPAGYWRGLKLAFRMGRGSLPATLSHLFYFAEAVIAGQWMLEKRYTHFHTHFSSTVGYLTTRIFPLTWSITIHGPEEFNDVAGFHMEEKVASAQLVVVISSYARSQVLRCCPPADWKKVVTFRLGVDGSVFEVRPAPSTAVPEVICVGRLAPVKAQHILIEAIGLLRARGLSVRLRLVGDGPDRASLEAATAQLGLTGDVIFDGWRNQDEVRERYRMASVFAMASFAEGIPVVLMEAMAMGIPCVATRIMGIPELIDDGASGLLVPPADAEALADAIARLLSNPELTARLTPEARRKVLADFDLDRNAGSLAVEFQRRLPTVGPSGSR
ncbi:MAG: glycosyltransferase family 4 protein [Bryobacterales bacterium]|nr:glycosyltransferase family 4 protein [Bryobacterales bacterium]